MARRRGRRQRRSPQNAPLGMALVTIPGGGDVARVHTGKPLRHLGAVIQSEQPFWMPTLGGQAGRVGHTIQSLKGLTPSLRELLLPPPTDRNRILQRIYAYARDIGLIKLWERRMADFGSAGFELTCANEEQQEFCNQIAAALNFDAVSYRLHKTLALAEQCVLWWRYYDAGEKRDPLAPQNGTLVPKWIEQIPPTVITFTNTGAVAVKANMLEPLASLARKRNLSSEETAYLRQFPRDLVKAASARGAEAIYPLERLNSDENRNIMGYTVMSHWGKDDWQKWPVPTLYAVLSDIEYLLLCQDIDYSAIHRLRAGIVLWKVGPKEPRPDTPAPNEPVLKALEERIRQSLAALHQDIFVGNDFTVEWVVPPKELFSPEKYRAALGRVMDLLDIPSIFYPLAHGQEDSARNMAFASSYIATQPFAQAVLARRRMIQRVIERFFWMLCYINGIGVSGEQKKPSRVEVEYDPNVLKESRTVLAEVMFAAKQGIISNRTAADALGRNYDAELVRRQEELRLMEKNPLLIMPYFAPSSGQSPAGDPGRPRTSDKPVDDDDSVQPKPSTSSLSGELVDADVSRDFFDAGIRELDEWVDPAAEVDAVLVEAALGPIIQVHAVEQTKDWIHIPVGKGPYKSYRYGKTRAGGIKFLYGIREDGKSEVATVLFKRPKWTLKEARKWLKEHKK